MKSKLVRTQLVIFGIVSILAVSNAVINYMGFQRYTKIGRYTVSAELDTAGGLYVNSLVTYRGVDVGVVTGIDIAPDKVMATLLLESDTKVPRDTDAHVRSVSAIGEQYIDLIPATDTEPYLGEGDVIDTTRTTTPMPAAEVIEEANTLLTALPKDDLRTTVDEAYAAFDDTGPALGRLIDSSRPLIALAQANLDPTLRLIDDAEPVLEDVNSAGPDIAAFSNDLASFSAQLAMNDNQLRSALDNGPAFFDSLGTTLTQLEAPLPVLLANLQTVGEVARVNVPGLRQILVVYPAFSAAINYMHQGFQGEDMTYGQGPLDIKLGNSANPLPCTEGYQETQRRDPSDLTPAEPAANPYCKLPQNDARAVRGARNMPCATDATVRTGEVAECPGGLPSTWPQMLSRPGAPFVPGNETSLTQPPPAHPTADTPQGGDKDLPTIAPASFAVPYDPASGRFRSPDGVLYSISTDNDKEALTWQSLFQR